ncbi:EF-hand calcium-binding domain-containing protein 12 [Mustelus asterias]
MVQTHFYRMASKMFGSPKCRLRVITTMPAPAQSQPRLWPQQQVAKVEEALSGTVWDEAVWGVADYTEWLSVRKRQRMELELMADVKRWINSKISANDLELRVLETLESHEWRDLPSDKTLTQQMKPESKLHHHMDLTEEFLLLTGEEHSMACHSLPTTMGGEMGEATNVYRQRCLMEYKKILQMCENYGISFTERMLEKALLHPGDKLKPEPELYLKLRQPGTSVLPAKHVEKRHSTRRQIASDQLNRELAQGKDDVQLEIGREKSVLKEVIEETGTKLRVPKTRRGRWKGKDARALSPSIKKQQMTLDDYTKYTRKLKMKLQPLTGLSPNIQANPRVFWPGHTLDKVRMHLPNVQLEHKDVFFSSTREDTRLSSHNYQIDKGWPISNQGYLTYGDIELNKRYWL